MGKRGKDLRKLDPDSQEYWEEVLRREGLSMTRGLYPRGSGDALVYGDEPDRHQAKPGSVSAPRGSVAAQVEQEFAEAAKSGTGGGRRTPAAHTLDDHDQD